MSPNRQAKDSRQRQPLQAAPPSWSGAESPGTQGFFSGDQGTEPPGHSHGRRHVDGVGEGGGEASLILIEEHLTYEDTQPRFRPGLQAGRLVENWYFPDEWEGPKEPRTPVLKIQTFKPGGYEATLRYLDIEKIGRAMDSRPVMGKREQPDELSPVNLSKASARAKTKVRHLVRNMAATHLCTLTRREKEGERETWWGPEEWGQAWDRLRRTLTKAFGGEFPYVAILERHQKGNFHLHVAWVGRIPLNVVRPAWWACCGGRGMGNVQAQYIKVPNGTDRSYRIARYISKYVTKSFMDDPRFNKKRYWASRQTLEDVRRYVLRSGSIEDALREMGQVLGLDWGRFMQLGRNGQIEHPHLFLFPDGCWLAYVPDIHTPPAPF